MKTKRFKISALIMSAVMMISTMLVFAGSTSTNFGSGEDAGVASLSCVMNYASASTDPAYSTDVSTMVSATLPNSYDTDYGQYLAFVENTQGFKYSGARSQHRINRVEKVLTVYGDW